MDVIVLLKSLEVVERKRNYKHASEELLVDQSTLNKRIKRLEKYYDIDLVVRSGNRVSITTAGKTILYKYKEIKKINNDFEHFIRRNKKLNIATISDIYLNSEIVNNTADNIVIEDDYKKLIADFNNNKFDILLIDNKFDELINYDSKEPYTSLEIGVLGSSDVADEIPIKEALEKYTFVSSKFDPFNQIINFHFQHEIGVDYEFFECDSIQDVISYLIKNKNSLFIVSNPVIIPDRLKTKIKNIRILNYEQSRKITRFNKHSN